MCRVEVKLALNRSQSRYILKDKDSPYDLSGRRSHGRGRILNVALGTVPCEQKRTILKMECFVFKEAISNRISDSGSTCEIDDMENFFEGAPIGLIENPPGHTLRRRV